MSPSYILGVDIAKRNIRFHRADSHGARRASGSVPTTAAGLTTLLASLAPLGAPATVLVVMETTGLFHVPWAEALVARGYPVYAVNALLAHRMQPLSNALRENKTDKLDAAGLTKLGRQYGSQLERFRYHSDPARFGLQRLQALRQQVRAQLTNLRKAYVSLLDVVFPELSPLLNQKVHNRCVRALLA
jgi:transposase